MIAFAALSGPVPKVGVIALAALVAATLLSRSPRATALAILAALALAPVLLLADIWHSPQLRLVHRHPLIALAGALAALAVIAAVAIVIARRPWLAAILTVIALPFRIPIQAGGMTSNLLVPLYGAVAAASLAYIVPTLRHPHPPPDPVKPAWLERTLALYVFLYAIQATYSGDFEKALQQMVFFYAPFALVFARLRALDWTPQLIKRCLMLIAGLAVLFAFVGFVEYATKTVFLNPKLIAENNLHAYFTVNSVFFDPDIFGRFLALVMILVVTVLLYRRRQREQLLATVVLAILWAALVLTLSRSSLGALLVGLGILAALKWKAWPVIVLGAIVVALGAAAIAISPKTFGLNQGLNGASSGRAGLVSGGIRLFRERPVAGYGSGSFQTEYRREHRQTATALSASHTIPITIAAEEGVIGELAYLALLAAAAMTLLPRTRTDPSRAAIAAAFVALVFHTMLYADFLEDPLTWTLLGIGVALAARPRAPAGRPEREAELTAVAA